VRKKPSAAHVKGWGKATNDPVLFARHVLGIEPWSRQAEMLRAVARHPRVAVRSGHKTGKSTSFAILALWFLYTRPRATVIMSSSSNRQVKSVLWKEVRRLHRKARAPLGGSPALDPGTGLRLSDGRELLGFTTDDTDRMGGFSGKNLLFLLDEASGISEAIYEAIEGNRAGGAQVAAFGNPIRTSGFFFDAFHSARGQWHTVHVSSEETPNVTGEGKPIEGLATREWVEEKTRDWGTESPLYAVRVRGDFPTQGDRAVIPMASVESATDLDVPEEGRLCIGVDVARFGDDDSVITPCRGFYSYEPIVISGQDNVQVAGRALEVMREMRRDDEVPRLSVDVIGVGSGVADILRASEECQSERIEVCDINVAEKATSDDEPGYVNLRSQLWFALRDWLRDGGSIPDDPRLHGELMAPLYDFDSRGRYRVESKEKMKARLGRSPDRADSLALAIYEPPPSGAWLL
jgi:hypothetical protein